MKTRSLLFSLFCSFLFSSVAYSGEDDMSLSALEKKLTASLQSRDVDAFMTLVAPDFSASDGSGYEALKGQMAQFFTQATTLEVKEVERLPADDGVEIATRLDLTMQGMQDPFPWTFYFVTEERSGGYLIVDIYDQRERQRRNSPLYDPGFNQDGLSAETLDLIDRRCGAWVGDDVEIVRGRKVEIRFWRDPDSPTGLWSQFSLLRYTDAGVEQHVRALVHADAATRTHRMHALDLDSFENREPFLNHPELAPDVTVLNWRFKKKNGDITALVSDRGEERFLSANAVELMDSGGNRQRFFPPKSVELVDPEGNRRRIERVEEIEVTAEKPPHPTPSEAPLGECLLSWQLGASILKQDEATQRVLIATRLHDYTFDIRKDYSYCRSSRFAVCDKGIVSRVDTRLMVNPNEYTSRMPDDMIERLRQPIEYDEALFDPTVCVTLGDTFYWSVMSTSDDLIQLHGCNGDIYPYHRSHSAQDRVEWFR